MARSLVVIDFIGNYNNNYLIPIALFGDDSLNKESLRKNLIAAEEVGVVAGLSSIRFDRIAQERVLRTLASAKLDSLHNLKAAIEAVRVRVGRTPSLGDFLRFESVDPVILATKADNYPELLAKVLQIDTGLKDGESHMLSVLSKEHFTAKRPHELMALRELLTEDHQSIERLSSALGAVGLPNGEEIVRSAIRSLTLEFNTASELKNFKTGGPVVSDGDITRWPTPSLRAIELPQHFELRSMTSLTPDSSSLASDTSRIDRSRPAVSTPAKTRAGC